VSLREHLDRCAPRLRRYARALVSGQPGPNEMADDLVNAVVLRTYETGASFRKIELYLHLYSLLTEWHREALAAGRQGAKTQQLSGGPHAAEKIPLLASPQDKLAGSLAALKLEEREALLLVVLEGFSYANAARILKISRAVLIARVSRARVALRQNSPAEILVHAPKLRPAYLRVVK
jgi:RNA polymerase sigma-70 factor, ECF subfamily